MAIRWTPRSFEITDAIIYIYLVMKIRAATKRQTAALNVIYHSAIRFNYLVRLNWFIISSLYNFTFFQKLAQEFRMLLTISLTIIFHPLYFAFTFQYYIQFPHTYSLLFFFIHLFCCCCCISSGCEYFLFTINGDQPLYLQSCEQYIICSDRGYKCFASPVFSTGLQMIGNGVSFWYVFF